MGTEEEVQEARIRKVGVLSVANISGFINAFVGFLIGLALVIFDYLFNQSPVVAFTSLNIPTYLIIIISTIGNGILGFIAGAIGAFLYNIAAKITKGIKLYSN